MYKRQVLPAQPRRLFEGAETLTFQAPPNLKSEIMQTELKREIQYLSRKKMALRKAKLKKDGQYRYKYEKRSGLTAQRSNKPALPYPHKHFDPKYCIRNKNFLAKSIWKSCLDGTYEPQPSLLTEIPKGDGGYREIMDFSIPDAALGRVVYRRINRRNLKKQSADSYAYRPDRNLFDALLRLRNSIDRPKVFIAQYDFKKFFDSIPHSYLLELINDKDRFTSTETERKIILSFMKHSYANRKNYDLGYFEKRKTGTPQGSSISLFLANLANDPLDKDLEKLNGQFIRYADDVVNIAYNYEDALRIENAFHVHCKRSGIELNVKKSKGISVLSEFSQEIRNAESFVFLGYKIDRTGFSISQKAKERIKQKISNLLNLYLLRHPRNSDFNTSRVGNGYDWDLLGCLSEIRNVIYGGLRESRIQNFLKTGQRPTQKKIRGYMSFYCLIENGEDFHEMDGWLCDAVYQACRNRKKYLQKMGYSYPSITKDNLISGKWYTPQPNKSGKGLFEPEVRLPSFVRGWRAARKFYYIFGLEEVSKPKYLGYSYL